MKTVAHILPPELYEFAIAKWHYDPKHHRSLHDSRIEEVRIEERTERKGEQPSTSIIMKLLGPYHDGYTILKYSGVSKYDFGFKGISHGDWLIDEITVESGVIVHEIILHHGCWKIESRGIHYETDIPNIR